MQARSFVPLFCSALAAGACGSSAPLTVASPPASAPSPTVASAEYEVHEWGLVRGAADDTQAFGAIAPPMDFSMMTVDKPVLYFHAPAALTLTSVGVEARSGGTLIETWPLTPLGTSASWTNVTVDPTGECTPSPLPSVAEAPCSTLAAGTQCETAALSIVRTDDAACVHVGASTERFLFYRGRATTFTPPLRFERTGAYETVRVTNEGDAPIPGMLVRLSSNGFQVRSLVVAPPAPHASIDVHADFDAAIDHTTADEPRDRRGSDTAPVSVSTGPGRRALIDTMLEIGLTQSEADAFMRAWEASLFGPGQVPIDTLSVDGDPTDRESFVYFLPGAALENVAHLDFDPAPSGGVHRAIAMWSMLRASGPSH